MARGKRNRKRNGDGHESRQAPEISRGAAVGADELRRTAEDARRAGYDDPSFADLVATAQARAGAPVITREGLLRQIVLAETAPESLCAAGRAQAERAGSADFQTGLAMGWDLMLRNAERYIAARAGGREAKQYVKTCGGLFAEAAL